MISQLFFSYVIVLRRISLRVRKRFPTMDHMIEAGLLMPDELKLMGGLSEKGSKVKVLPYTLSNGRRPFDSPKSYSNMDALNYCRPIHFLLEFFMRKL